MHQSATDCNVAMTVRHFGGGHMFYQWEESRKAFSAAIAGFMADAVSR